MCPRPMVQYTSVRQCTEFEKIFYAVYSATFGFPLNYAGLGQESEELSTRRYD